MTTTADRRVDLLSDTRGAVMITGLFLSFFLIGALWFVMGVGDSIVFRDRMQEAADHAAFTSAALHAKGMNFISALNLIMLALVVVHLVLGLIHDITLVVCFVTGVGCAAWFGVRNVYTNYAALMKPVLTGIHNLERAAAYGYPYVGLVKSIKVGEKYGKQHRVGDVDVFAISPSMIPDLVSRSSRVGLPVAQKPMNELCVKASDWTFDKVLLNKGYDPNQARGMLDQVLGKLSEGISFVTGGRWGGPSDTEKVLQELAKVLQGAVVNRYCNPLFDEPTTKTFRDGVKKGNEKIDKNNKKAQEDFNKNGQQGPAPLAPRVDIGIDLSKIDPGFDAFWGSEGPLYVDDSAQNGNFYMQVWAINFRPRMKDPNEGKVKIAAREYDGRGSDDNGPLGYFAQAEFYFDCGEAWSDQDCNGAGNDRHASYSLRWRARLRHVEIPNFGKLVGEQLYALATNSDAYKGMRNVITADNALYDKLANGPFSGAAVEELKKIVDEKVAEGEAAAKTRLIDGLQNAHDAVLDGVYH